MKLATCIGCGCDDEHACIARVEHEVVGDRLRGYAVPCSWLRVDHRRGRGVCSECRGQVARWDAGWRALTAKAKRAVSERKAA